MGRKNNLDVLEQDRSEMAQNGVGVGMVVSLFQKAGTSGLAVQMGVSESPLCQR